MGDYRLDVNDVVAVAVLVRGCCVSVYGSKNIV